MPCDPEQPDIWPDECPGTRPSQEPQTNTILAPDPGWKVVLYNDDITPFDVVVFALMKAAGLSGEVAEAVADEAHRRGLAIVRRGLQEAAARLMCDRLHAASRVVGVCPGVDCEAQHDDT